MVVPAGYRPSNRAPYGVALLGRAGADAGLLSLALGLEGVLDARRPVSQVNPALLRG